MTRRVVAASLVAAAVIAGCAPLPTSRPAAAPSPPQREARTERSVAAGGAPVAAPVSTVALRGDSVERVARQATVRVRSRSCGRIGTASGVAVGPRLLVTNRHVVEGSAELELNFWDGTSARARMTALAVADDLALAEVSVRLPTVARLADPDAAARAEVLVVGYPEGGRQTITRGKVVEYARLRAPVDASPVMRMSADIAPGNSGGAVVDRAGALVGVVFGIETETGYGLAVPASAITALIADGGTDAAPTCA